MKKFNYDEFFKKIKLKKNDNVIINSSFLSSLIFFKKKKIQFDVKEFLKNISKKISQGNLLIPTYNWDFCKGKVFDINKFETYSGALSKTALRNKLFKRSSNPIYSFAVYGKDQKKIISMKHVDCFSMNSPFGFLIKKKGKNIFFNLDYKDAFTFVHVAEQSAKVDYRYKKVFLSDYKNEKGIVEVKKIKMYVRKNINKTVIDKKLDKVLLDKKFLIKINYPGFDVQIIDIFGAYNEILKNLKNKRNLVYPL